MVGEPQSRAIAVHTLRVMAWLFGGGGVLLLALRLTPRRPTTAGPTALQRHSLLIRFATLLALMLVTVGVAYAGALVFALAVLVLVMIALDEVWRVLGAAGVAPYRLTGSLAGALIVGVSAWGGAAVLGPAVAIVVAAMLCAAFLVSDRVQASRRIGATMTGVGYVALLGAFLVLLRRDVGFGGVIFLIAVVQVADVSSLLGGIALGRHRLAPALSPGKTWEGTIIGLAGGIAGALLFRFTLPDYSIGAVLATGAALAVLAVAGDLVASGFKREAGVKDFGQILPGHGGVLDRFDGCLLAAPVAWLILRAWSVG